MIVHELFELGLVGAQFFNTLLVLGDLNLAQLLLQGEAEWLF